MKRLLVIIPLALLLLSGCREKRWFTDVSYGVWGIARISFEDGSFEHCTIVKDVLYAGEDSTSRYKMVFYMPDGWDDSYPLFLDRYVPDDEDEWFSDYQLSPVAEEALKSEDMIVVLVAYEEQTAIPDILLAEHFLKEHDADLPGDSKMILTAAYFDFE